MIDDIAFISPMEGGDPIEYLKGSYHTWIYLGLNFDNDDWQQNVKMCKLSKNKTTSVYIIIVQRQYLFIISTAWLFYL